MIQGSTLRWGIRQTLLVCRQELAEALRSRRAAVILFLYLTASALAMNGALSALQRLENELAAALQLPPSPEPGSVVRALWKSDRFRKMVSAMTGSPALAEQLVGTSPIVLIYSGLIFLFTPVLAVLAAAPRISEETASGSARFALIRTSRGIWSTGKALGQVALVAFSLLLSAAGAWIVSRFRMPGAEGLDLAVGMVLESFRALFYSLPYLGLAIGVSQSIKSVSRATGAALAGLFLLGILAWASARYEGDGLAQGWAVVRQLTPQAYRVDLWFRDPARCIPAALALTVLGSAYTACGFVFFRRKDL